MLRVLALLSVVLVFVTGCGGTSNKDSDKGEPGAGTVVAEAPLPNLEPALRDAAASARGMTYRSRSGIDDDNTHVTGSVFVPKGDAPDGGFPVVALAPRTVGTAADCAASLSPNLLGNSATVQALLKAGYVVFVPDHQGLGHPSDGKTIYHPYLDSTTAGYVIIDGVRAARTMVPAASTSWAALGSFEGGQAAWAANELVENYGSGLELVATASTSPLADFEGLADNAMAGTLTPDQKLVYVAFLAAINNEYPYDFELDDYRRGAAEKNWDALQSCQDNAARGALAAQIPPDDLRPANPAALDALRGYLQKTTLPQGPTQAPMYVIYGGRDPVIPAAWTERALTRACKLGDGIQIAYWPDQAGQIDPLAATGWLGDRFKSIPAANDCGPFTAGHP